VAVEHFADPCRARCPTSLMTQGVITSTTSRMLVVAGSPPPRVPRGLGFGSAAVRCGTGQRKENLSVPQVASLRTTGQQLSCVCSTSVFRSHPLACITLHTAFYIYLSPTRLLATRQRIKRRTLENRAAAERKEEQRYNVEQRGSIGNMCSYIFLVILSLSLSLP
jgi:hypothetical protein